MLIGVLLIVFGVLVACFPQILVVMVSGFFMVTGFILCGLSLRLRRAQRDAGPALARWIRF